MTTQRIVLCLALAACQATGRTHAPESTRAAASHEPVAHAPPIDVFELSIVHRITWYNDTFMQFHDKDVVVSRELDPGRKSVRLTIRSNAPSGVTLVLTLTESADGSPVCQAEGEWRSDRGPQRGPIRVTSGIVGVSSVRVASDPALRVEFALRIVGWNFMPELLQGCVDAGQAQ